MIQPTQSRLTTLNNRYEALILSNQNNGYVRNEKASRYLETIKNIKAQIFAQEQANREANKNSSLSQFLKASRGMNGFQILRATTQNNK